MNLAPESRDCTCFIIFCFVHTRGPMGFISTGDHYNLHVTRATEGLEHTSTMVDDNCIASNTFSEHVEHVKAFLRRCRTHGITLSPTKMVFAQQEVKFLGCNISAAGAAPDPKKLNAIAHFPAPTSRTDLKSFLGLVNQLGQFTTGISEAAEPLRGLLKSGKNEQVYQWLPIHQTAFENLKGLLIQPPVLAQYDPTAELVLETDASKTRGLGYALFQRITPKCPDLSATAQSADCQPQGGSLSSSIRKGGKSCDSSQMTTANVTAAPISRSGYPVRSADQSDETAGFPILPVSPLPKSVFMESLPAEICGTAIWEPSSQSTGCHGSSADRTNHLQSGGTDNAAFLWRGNVLTLQPTPSPNSPPPSLEV